MMLSNRASLCDMSIMEVAAEDHPPDRMEGRVHRYEACWTGSNLHERIILSLPFVSILNREISAQRPPLDLVRFASRYPLPFYQEDVVMDYLLLSSVCYYVDIQSDYCIRSPIKDVQKIEINLHRNHQCFLCLPKLARNIVLKGA
jgi:hypothetical protein